MLAVICLRHITSQRVWTFIFNPPFMTTTMGKQGIHRFLFYFFTDAHKTLHTTIKSHCFHFSLFCFSVLAHLVPACCLWEQKTKKQTLYLCVWVFFFLLPVVFLVFRAFLSHKCCTLFLPLQRKKDVSSVLLGYFFSLAKRAAREDAPECWQKYSRSAGKIYMWNEFFLAHEDAGHRLVKLCLKDREN